MFFIRSLMLILLLGCVTIGRADNLTPDQAITVGIVYSEPPFIYNASIGFDINLMQKICQLEHLRCTFVNTTFNAILDDLKAPQGKLDAAISAISITKERQKTYLFTAPYYQSTMSFLAKSTEAKTISLSQLKQQKLGIIKNTTFYFYLKSLFGSENAFHFYEDDDELLQSLAENEVDAITLDTPAAEYWQTKSNCQLHIVSNPIKIPDDQGYGIIIRKTNPALQATLNEGLAWVKNSPYYAQIIDSYFSNQLTRCST